MPFIGISILIQILCAVHCVRNGRNSMWLTVILLLSIPGCLAYAFFEILPDYKGRREVRAAQSAAIRKLDPEREVRAARDALDLADTVANRLALADALAETGAKAEAVPHYEAALAKAPAGERAGQARLARVLLDLDRPREARDILRALPPTGSPSERDRGNLLLARALDACGEHEEALSLYADVGERLPGGEAQCRRAALLMALGRDAEAEPVLEEVDRLARRLDRFERAKEREMYDWAARSLAELRSGTTQDGA